MGSTLECGTELDSSIDTNTAGVSGSFSLTVSQADNSSESDTLDFNLTSYDTQMDTQVGTITDTGVGVRRVFRGQFQFQ